MLVIITVRVVVHRRTHAEEIFNKINNFKDLKQNLFERA